MLKDIEEGWWGAPAAPFWKCPECKQISPTVLWEECEVGCEDCGSHEARKCPQCDEAFDHVWGADKIAEATDA